jgi:hypothetical protein
MQKCDLRVEIVILALFKSISTTFKDLICSRM